MLRARIQFKKTRGGWCRFSPPNTTGAQVHSCPKPVFLEVGTSSSSTRGVTLKWNKLVSDKETGCDPVTSYQMEYKRTDILDAWRDINSKKIDYMGNDAGQNGRSTMDVQSGVVFGNGFDPTLTAVNLVGCKNYRFRGRSQNSACESDYSNNAAIRLPGCEVKVVCPQLA